MPHLQAFSALHAIDAVCVADGRRQHKEEMVKLQQQLKSTTMSSKGGQQETDRAKKELDKTR